MIFFCTDRVGKGATFNAIGKIHLGGFQCQLTPNIGFHIISRQLIDAVLGEKLLYNSVYTRFKLNTAAR